MSRAPATHIDESLCTGCGLCVQVCPDASLSLVEGKSRVTGEVSMHCGQCAAVCPAGAISVDDLRDIVLDLSDVPPVLETLFGVMRRRRSCRAYRSTPVSRPLLEDLVKMGITAPSGTACQRWAFTLLPDRNAMDAFAREIAGFYKRLNRLARNPILRFVTKLFAKDVLGKYYRRYHDTVAEALDIWEAEGRDLLFHGAPSGIVVSAHQDASCPGEDALLATQNILLAAESLGLGTCLIGFAVAAMQQDRRIGGKLGIPKEERVYTVIAIGHPSVRYARPARRKPPVVRYFERMSSES